MQIRHIDYGCDGSITHIECIEMSEFLMVSNIMVVGAHSPFANSPTIVFGAAAEGKPDDPIEPPIIDDNNPDAPDDPVDPPGYDVTNPHFVPKS